MGDLEYEKSDHEWAREKGLIRKCSNCGREYDPNVGCTNPKCIEKRLEEKIRKQKESEKQEERKQSWEDTSAKIIWPDNKPPKLGKDKKKKKWFIF